MCFARSSVTHVFARLLHMMRSHPLKNCSQVLEEAHHTSL